MNVDIVRQVFLRIIQRHEALKTTFNSSFDGKPQLKIEEVTKLNLPIIDLQNLPQQSERIKKIAQSLAQHPFNLETEIPIRLRLIKISQAESIIIIVLHHIIADGWSRGILLKEFALLYKSISNNSPDPLKAIAIRYTDFAAWEKQWLAGEEQRVQLEYWRKQLANLSVLDLPTDYPRPSVQTFKGRTDFFELSPELTEQLKSLSRQQGVSLFMTLLTAFKILLHRYTGEKDIAVGSPIANRNLPEVRDIIGFFVNTLVLRSDLSDNPSFNKLLTKIKTTTNQAYQHQELPFGKLVEELHPDRNLSQNPLFQVMIQFQNQAYGLQNAIAPEFAIPDLNLTQEWLDTGATKFDLTFHLIERDGITTAIEYRSDLFHAETITRMFGHFKTLLTNIVNHPQGRISELSILTPAESQQILYDWNQTSTKLPLESSFCQLFEQQVKQTPKAIAVETLAGETLTYRQLNEKANQLAIYLRFQGVKIETKVGICLERSPELIISLLAIQKAGGTYIPLDPNYPRSRLKYIIKDANISTILTTVAIANNCLPASSRDSLIYLEQNLSRIDRYSSSNLSVKIHPQNLAYIIYTSGSTGKPKGTMITHRGLINYLTWATTKYPIATGNGFPVHSSISFDATITSLYSALLVGQQIILFPEENELETLKDVLNSDRKYSAIKLTPAHLNAVASLSESEATVKPAQTFVIGGEALTTDAIAYWQKRAPDTQFINEYGPTETVVGCCTYEVPRKSISHHQIPIGNPIANTQLYIMDEYLQPVPVGIPGELYIGGDGVARGYLQQPGLTAERFIPNPFSLNISRQHGLEGFPHRVTVEGEHLSLNISSSAASSAPLLYKTGDRAKYLPDGKIEYLGRLDNQIKIRGYRIELGEIEAVLTSHPMVESALVIAHEERLIAYIILDNSPPASPAPLASPILRAYIRDRLPSYMIPGNFVTLNRFPLTPNGKIDRAALIIPDVEKRAEEIIEPRTEKEHILTKIWREVLNIKKIGVEDNFFELGGDSILSIQIIARARQAGLTLTPKQLFQYQTIAELAAVAEVNQPIYAEQGLVTGEVLLTPIQHWFFEQDLVNFSHYNQAVLLEIAPDLNVNWLQLALNHLVSHHDALRMRFDRHNSVWRQFNLATVENICLTVIDKLDDEFASTITNVAEQLQTSLDITQGKLVAGALFKQGGEKSDRLLLIIHHLVVDGVSWRILLEDLAIAYQQLQDNKSPQLQSKTTSYQHWGETLEQYAEQIDIKAELDYWLKRKTTSIPTDKTPENNTNTVASMQQVSISLDAANTEALLTKVSQAYNTRIDDILLTALIKSFYISTNAKELRFDLENYGREQIADNIDLTRTVGWFTTIYPVQLKIDSINSLGATIKSVKEQLRTFQNKGFNYGILKYLNSESSQQLQQLPSPQISFNYLGQLKPPPAESIIKGLAKEAITNTRNP
ncbi:MAG: amino acid adenylation domain-containing protein, partial [Cyanobacteria bacterium J06629_2]